MVAKILQPTRICSRNPSCIRKFHCSSSFVEIVIGQANHLYLHFNLHKAHSVAQRDPVGADRVEVLVQNALRADIY